ncbi:protein adenylyltransferase SelO family protein, partial [Acinetobacter baumannii]
YFNDDGAGDDAPLRLLSHVVNRTARLAGQLMAAGFVHGVLNSDNINVTGECFDYGPWRFTPNWDPGFVAAYFDHNGLY